MTESWNLSTNSYIVFDVDGVLIDVSESFDFVVKATVESFLNSKGQQYDVDTGIIRKVRSRGKFPQDYDLCITVLAGYIQNDGAVEKMRQFACEFPEGGGIQSLNTVDLSLPEKKEVKKIFDNFYCNNDGRGYWEREKSIADKSLLCAAKRVYKTAIITGRSPFEMSLARKIMPYTFDKVITNDDFEKPDPDALYSIVGQVTNGIYVGDTLNDRRLVHNYNEKFKGNFQFAHIGKDFEDVNEFLKTLEL